MSFFDDLLGRAGSALGGAAAGSALGPIGAIGGGILGALGGGGGGSSSSSQSGGGRGADFYAQYGAQAAAANTPITLAATRFAADLGNYAGALQLYGRGQNQANQSILQGAVNRAERADVARGSEILAATTGALDVQQQATKGQFDLAFTFFPN